MGPAWPVPSSCCCWLLSSCWRVYRICMYYNTCLQYLYARTMYAKDADWKYTFCRNNLCLLMHKMWFVLPSDIMALYGSAANCLKQRKYKINQLALNWSILKIAERIGKNIEIQRPMLNIYNELLLSTAQRWKVGIKWWIVLPMSEILLNDEQFCRMSNTVFNLFCWFANVECRSV